MSNNNKILFELLRYISLTFIIIFGFITIVASGGGDGGDGDTPPPTITKTAPLIANFSYSPTSTTVGSGGGAMTVNGAIDFIDKDNDISTLIIEIFDDSGNQVDQIYVPIEVEFGQISGTIGIEIIFDTSEVGSYTFELYAVDETDRVSNVLIGTFDVEPDSSGGNGD